MQAKDIIKLIKQDVLAVKQQQQEFISVDAMANYLDSLEKHADDDEKVDKQKFGADSEAFRAEHERNLEHYKAQQLFDVEMFRSVIGYGQAALKSAILINGGAAVALLAFIGNIWAKGVRPDVADSLTNGIVLFASGVLAAAVGTGGSYFTQYYYHIEGPERAAIYWRRLTILVVLLAFILFGFGACESYQAFVEHLTHDYVSQPTQ